MRYSWHQQLANYQMILSQSKQRISLNVFAKFPNHSSSAMKSHRYWFYHFIVCFCSILQYVYKVRMKLCLLTSFQKDLRNHWNNFFSRRWEKLLQWQKSLCKINLVEQADLMILIGDSISKWQANLKKEWSSLYYMLKWI